MNDFHGIAMMIDEKIELLNNYSSEDQIEESSDKFEYNRLKNLVSYFEKNGIPLIKIYDTDLDIIKKKIEKTNNVRLLILDLDLNGDGEVLEDDLELVNKIVNYAIDKYSYFFILIFSNQSERWEDVKNTFGTESKERIFIEKMSSPVAKTGDNLPAVIEEKISSCYSLNLISTFERNLNIARDKAFREFIEFDTNTWENLLLLMKDQTGDICHFNITNIFMSILKQNMLGIKYNDDVQNTVRTDDNNTLYRIYRDTNFIYNKDNLLSSQPIWTGNFYYTSCPSDGKKFALVITPECDIAQKKNMDVFHILYGFEIDPNSTFSPYDENDVSPPPLFPQRIGKTKQGKWRSRNELNIVKNCRQDYLYFLHRISNDHSICIDFRFGESIKKEILETWDLKLRVIDPLINDITTKYSKYINRKGTIDFEIKNFIDDL